MKLELLNADTAAVRSFLWEHVDPGQIRRGLDRSVAIAGIVGAVRSGMCLLIGNLEERIVFRLDVPNRLVCHVHVMGDGLKIRRATPVGLAMLWLMGFDKVVAQVQDVRLARILKRVGFGEVARLPGFEMDAGGALVDTVVLVKERKHGSDLVEFQPGDDDRRRSAGRSARRRWRQGGEKGGAASAVCA